MITGITIRWNEVPSENIINDLQIAGFERALQQVKEGYNQGELLYTYETENELYTISGWWYLTKSES